mgnify:FL=1
MSVMKRRDLNLNKSMIENVFFLDEVLSPVSLALYCLLRVDMSSMVNSKSVFLLILAMKWKCLTATEGVYLVTRHMGVSLTKKKTPIAARTSGTK